MAEHRFDKVDDSDPAKCIAFLDSARTLDDTQRAKQRSYEMLSLQLGQRVLDVGCGTGEDVCALARVVGPNGQSIGVDASQSMISEAARRANSLELPVAFCRGDIYKLPFETGYFDACKTDRLLHFLEAPESALREMCRVTAIGGRIVVGEPDWNTLEVSGGDEQLTAVILGTSAGNPLASQCIGGRLPELFSAVGLGVEQVETVRVEIRDFKSSMELFGLALRARNAAIMERVTVDVAKHWLQTLAEAARQDRLRCTLTSTTAAGINLPARSR